MLGDTCFIRTEIFRWKLLAVASESQREMERSVNALAAIAMSLLVELKERHQEIPFDALFFKPSAIGMREGKPHYDATPFPPIPISPETPICQKP